LKAASSVTQDWPWRHGIGPVWESFRRRLTDARFWVIQAMIAAITVIHYVVEAVPVDESISIVHHVPVILYLLPVVYASLYYGWEGGVLTAIWAGVLTVPSILISHREDFHWVGEVGQVGVTLAVGTVLAWRVKLEAEQRQRAERTSRELSVSERKYRSIFENAEDPIVVCDAEGNVVAANDALARITGYVSTLGLSARDLFGEDGGRRLVSDSAGSQLRLALHRKDGPVAIVDAARTVLESDDGNTTVQAILRDVTEQERRHQDMRAYVREVTKAQEEERTRIARELHDDTAQSLVLLCRGLDLAQTSERNEKVDEMRSLADSILEGVRRFSRDLRPSILDDLGLIPAIEWVSSEATSRGVVSASVEVTGTPRRLSEEAELALFRIAQEALRNAEKHAGECSVDVLVEFGERDVRLTVSDDGRGFAVDAGNYPAQAGALGLVGMRERAELLGADFEVESRPGEGATVRVILPTR
jgi:two-component system sensor histidine kinase DegS